MTDQIEPKEVVNQLAESLSAMRIGLHPKVQNLLDDVVANSAFDVSAHGVTAVAAIPTVDAAATANVIDMAAVANQVDDDIEDVVAHGLEASGRIKAEPALIKLRFSDRVGYAVIRE